MALHLTALPRPPITDRGNLFIRLTPKTACRLVKMSLIDGSADGGEMQDTASDAPSVIDEVAMFDVEFLPLQITFQDKDETITVYGSYNGGSPASLVSSHYNGEMFARSCCTIPYVIIQFLG